MTRFRGLFVKIYIVHWGGYFIIIIYSNYINSASCARYCIALFNGFVDFTCSISEACNFADFKLLDCMTLFKVFWIQCYWKNLNISKLNFFLTSNNWKQYRIRLSSTILSRSCNSIWILYFITKIWYIKIRSYLLNHRLKRFSIQKKWLYVKEFIYLVTMINSRWSFNAILSWFN